MSDKVKYEFNKEKSDKIDELVLKYQDGSKQSAEDLLENFVPLISYYVDLFTSNFGEKFMRDFHTSNFLRMISGKGSDDQKAVNVAKNLSAIRIMYGSQDEDYIVSDMQMLLLMVAKRYKPTGKSFLGYVGSSFHYEVIRYVFNYMKSPSLFSPNCIANFIDGTFKQISYLDQPDEIYFRNLCLDDFGFITLDWVISNDNFYDSNLTHVGKLLLLLYYQDDWKDDKTSEVLKIHINTVNQKRRQAARELSNTVNFNVIRRRVSGFGRYANYDYEDKVYRIYLKCLELDGCDNRTTHVKENKEKDGDAMNIVPLKKTSIHTPKKEQTKLALAPEPEIIKKDDTKIECAHCDHLQVCKFIPAYVDAITNKDFKFIHMSCSYLCGKKVKAAVQKNQPQTIPKNDIDDLRDLLKKMRCVIVYDGIGKVDDVSCMGLAFNEFAKIVLDAFEHYSVKPTTYIGRVYLDNKNSMKFTVYLSQRLGFSENRTKHILAILSAAGFVNTRVSPVKNGYIENEYSINVGISLTDSNFITTLDQNLKKFLEKNISIFFATKKILKDIYK